MDVVDEGQLRQYLLGRLSELEREEIENLAFRNHGFEEHLSEVEYGLLDEWARGGLSELDRAAVERRYPDARLNGARTAAGRKTVRISIRRSVAWMLALLAAAASMLLVSYWREARELRAELESARQATSTPRTVAAIAVPASGEITVPVRAAIVRVAMTAEPGWEHYEMRIESLDRGPILSQTSGGPGGNLAMYAPAELFSAGSYNFVVWGRRGFHTKLLGTYPCRIARR